jgi:hypothetical protein
MRGSIRPRGKNKWQIQVYMGIGPDGKYRRHFETINGCKGDAQRKLTEIKAAYDKGIYTPSGRITVAEHLYGWLQGYVKTNCHVRTLDGYQSIIDHHLIPAFGYTHLKQLQPHVIQAYYGKAVSKLSPRTVHHHHRVLSQVCCPSRLSRPQPLRYGGPALSTKKSYAHTYSR